MLAQVQLAGQGQAALPQVRASTHLQPPAPATSWALPGQHDWMLPTSAAAGFSFSISSRPIPARLVQQIRTGRYVEMQELSGDNAAVRRQLEELQGTMGTQLLPVFSRPKLREVATLPTWITCFLTYLAVGTTDNVWNNVRIIGIIILYGIIIFIVSNNNPERVSSSTRSSKLKLCRCGLTIGQGDRYCYNGLG